MSGQRTFTRVRSNGQTEGIYKSTTPSGAAKKAFNKMEVAKATVTIRETTQGSHKKEYKYHCERKKLKKAVTVERDGQVIKFKYETKITAA